MIPIRRTAALLAAAGAATVLFACGGGSGTTVGTGTLKVSLTDAPACGYDQVNVTVSKVRVHSSDRAGDSDDGWRDITLSPARKINLLDLNNGVLLELGQTSLPEGRYTQVRLVLDPNTGNGGANTVVPTGSVTEISLDTPSAVQSGIKLTHAFDIAARQRTDLVLDFDACKSIVAKGNGGLALKPVVAVIPALLNGIHGYVDPALAATGRPAISAQRNGEVIRSTVPNPATGEFTIARLEPGNYDVVITADNSAAAVVAGVPVASTTSMVELSTAAAPIRLAIALIAPGSVSGVVQLSPPSVSDSALMSARQSFASGPTVTIRYQYANLTSGAWVLSNLPRAVPLYASYSAALPLVFSASGNVAPGVGQYAVTAAAIGYTAQTLTPVDLSTGNKSAVDFILLP
ncbi:DUF4382 domain-containing protein [Lacisediminimonas profundi]|uniref:DUF4382 domain-containing protein n=1 Tax=Lacisediminimonas profundi TaxID=2603856 RepID=UPI001F4F3876|nr:DUF4382 domain-containing protein [Lacisediminimonas profundi]